jgi:hypothetical protein
MVAVLVHKWGIRGRRFRSNLFWFKVVFSGIQDKGVPVIIAVDTRADLQKLAEVVSEPTSPILHILDLVNGTIAATSPLPIFLFNRPQKQLLTMIPVMIL